MRTPLKNESKIPQGKKPKHETLCNLGKPERAEKPANSFQQKGQAEKQIRESKKLKNDFRTTPGHPNMDSWR